MRLPRTFNYILRELPKVPTHVPVCVLGNYRDMGEHRVILPDDARDFIDNLDRWVPARRRGCCGRPVRLGRSCLRPPLPRALAAHPAARPRVPRCASSPGFPAPPGPHPAPPGWGRRPGGRGVGGHLASWHQAVPGARWGRPPSISEAGAGHWGWCLEVLPGRQAASSWSRHPLVGARLGRAL